MGFMKGNISKQVAFKPNKTMYAAVILLICKQILDL